MRAGCRAGKRERVYLLAEGAAAANDEIKDRQHQAMYFTLFWNRRQVRVAVPLLLILGLSLWNRRQVRLAVLLLLLLGLSLGSILWPSNFLSNFSTTSQFPHPTSFLHNQSTIMTDTPLHFLPGTLKITRLEAFQHCHVDPVIYEKHFIDDYKAFVSISKQHSLLYHFLPKSGSSTSRWIMKNVFNATEFHQPSPEWHNYFKMTFVREPLGRFFSGYHEMFLRTFPYKSHSNPYKSHSKQNSTHPFPFLHEGLGDEDVGWNLDLWDQKKTRETKSGTLLQRFERFVKEYDGVSPFDAHLHLQTVLLMYRNHSGSVIRPFMDGMYDTMETKEIYDRIAIENGLDLPKSGAYRVRSSPTQANYTAVGIDTMDRICHLMALDYCCLNFPLPLECQESGVMCTLERFDEQWKIRPASYPTETHGRHP